jgi:hypothetical protein
MMEKGCLSNPACFDFQRVLALGGREGAILRQVCPSKKRHNLNRKKPDIYKS